MQEIFDNSKSFKEVLEKIGLSAIGNNYNTLHKYIDMYDLSTGIIDEKRKSVTSHGRYDTEEKFIEAIKNGTCRLKSKYIIERLVKYGLKEYCCESCGIDSWNGKPITLELHHENGNHDDNHLYNIKILCPNCHSQTDNFRALNITKKDDNVCKNKIDKKIIPKRERTRIYKKKICHVCNINEIHATSNMCRDCYYKSVKAHLVNNNEIIKVGHNLKDLCPVCEINYKITTSKMCNDCRIKERTNPKISKEELEQLIYNTPFTKIGEIYNVSDNAVRKWCKKYGLPYRKKDITLIKNT